jgi:D-arabinose 1-dehydrogenase-like Zn-dependent alcohol dehydrogenase
MNDVDTMQAVLITGRDALQQGCLPIPAVKPGHILIETAFVGICGTDVHLLEGDSFYLEHQYLNTRSFLGMSIAAGWWLSPRT